MSSEIYYDRAFICVNGLYIPLVNQGSNNSWTTNLNGRDIPVKGWQVLNWRNRSKLLYTEEEVRGIAADYEKISQESGSCLKTRNRRFEHGEFGRWIFRGLKSAFTIEEYVAAGNTLEIHDFSGDYDDWKTYPFSSTETFLSLLEQLEGRPMLNIHFENRREVYRPLRSISKSPRPEEFYVLTKIVNSAEMIFCRLTRRSLMFVKDIHDPRIRIFRRERDAFAYMERYARSVKNQCLKIRKVVGVALATDTGDSVEAG
jgi:hypothetical protein